MSTFLFDKVIFGPVTSRRLGVSLGVNLLSPSSKHCNFDCIYCECGWNADNPHGSFNSTGAVVSRLEAKLQEMASVGELPNYITFAGNGEPTMHPDFLEIIKATIELRGKYAPECKIAVLTNGTMVDKDDVRSALMAVDRNIIKLDSAIDDTVRLINQPKNYRSIEQTIELYKKFNGKCVVQTMFIRGVFNGIAYDNTTQVEVSALLTALKAIAPCEVMLYSTDRDTPSDGVGQVSKSEMEAIASRITNLGIKATVS